LTLRPRGEIEASEGRDISQLAKRRAGSLLYIAMVCGAIVLSLGLTFRFNRSFDVTRQGQNTLSPQSRAVLQRLREPVKLYALLKKQPADRWERYWNELRKYRVASDRFDAELIDPVARPGIVKQLGLDPEQEGTIDGLTVVVQGDRRHRFRGFEEEDITNALLEVGREGRRVVGLLRGYGERDPAGQADASFSSAVAALRQEYYELRDVWLSDGIPPDVEVLIAAGPALPIPPPELERLAAWLERGGRLLALLEPGEGSDLNTVLDRWGLRGTGTLIVDPRENVNRDPRFIRVTHYSGHEAVRELGANYPTQFPTAGAVEHFEVGGTIYHEDLARSSRYSFGLAEDGTRTAGPLAVAAAAWRQEQAGSREVVTRLVVVGDSDFSSRAYLPARANRNFLLNCVAWLTRQQERIALRRQKLEGQRVELTPEDAPVLYGVLLSAPALVVVTGFIVFVRRRRL
jgi:hypothetical protein